MNKLLVTGLESRMRVYDLRTQHPSDGFAFATDKVRRLGCIYIYICVCVCV